MRKIKFIKALMLGMCLSVLSTGAAFAKTVEDAELMATSVIATSEDSTSEDSTDIATTMMIQQVDEKSLEKQLEVDKYLFEDHKDEIASKGFTVTHTVPLDGYVEIGISPYTPENADYLYQALGEDMIKIVDGVQAAVLENDSDIIKPDETVTDDELMSTTGIVESENVATTDDELMSTTGIVDGETVATTDDELMSTTGTGTDTVSTTDNKDNNSSMIILICIAGAAVLLSAFILFQKKKNK